MIESEVFKRYQLPIEELRPKIIDTIVEVYGKRHRAQIEDRLNTSSDNTHFHPQESPEATTSLLWMHAVSGAPQNVRSQPVPRF